MATMFPKEILNPKSPSSEIKVFDCLRGLDEDWMVFHSVAWQGMRGGRQNDGEADFVVAHPRKGALIIEVKGGGISVVDGQWFATDRYGKRHRIKNPFDQVRDSKHALGEFLAERLPRVGNKVHLGQAVWFPDIEVTGDLSPEAKEEIILDRRSLSRPGPALGQLAHHWGDLTRFDEEQFAGLKKALAPTQNIRRLLRHEVEDRVDDLIKLTDQQASALGFLRNQRQALIVGGAGTGKTVLAIERARQLADSGLNVLLVCFNKPLGQMIKRQVRDIDNILADSFHTVATALAGKAGLLPEGNRDREYWSRALPEAMVDAVESSGEKFDAIIVDEGQDFEPDWWLDLRLMLSDPDKGFFYIFADSHQNLYRDDWVSPVDLDPFPLDVNCRNTRQIADRVGAIYGRDETTLGVNGPEPIFHEVPKAAIMKRLRSLVEKLLDYGDLKPEQIAILSTQRDWVERLRQHTIGSHPLGEADEPGITVETVRRFKGLEANAVVLVLPSAEDADIEALAYVGLSRARVVLHVLGPPEVKKAINWN